MSIQKRTKTLSALTRGMLGQGESHGVDFKKISDGVSAEDLVAFANSANGGQILVGVIEKSMGGAQVGEVQGCDVSDAAILQILNKASSCIPPVSLDVFIENLGRKPILRLAIPSSETKPHCTPKGVYCLRDGTRTRPLHPGELLRIFLNTEAKAFADRFESAAERITEDLTELEDTLSASIESMGNKLGWAEYQLGDTESTVDSILAYVKHLSDESDDIALRLRSLLHEEKRKDPVKDRVRKKFIADIIEEVNKNPEIRKAVLAGQSLSFTPSGKAAKELSEAELRSAFQEAAKTIYREEDLKKYSFVCKVPMKCSECELDAFASLVTAGGEVAPGIRARIEGAFRLGLIEYQNEVVGTAALKKPKSTYQANVFHGAKSDLDPSDFPFELGWIFLKEAHRGRGRMTVLLEHLLKLAGDKNIFATTRSGNSIMKEVLLQFGFSSSGEPYPSAEHPEETIELYALRREG